MKKKKLIYKLVLLVFLSIVLVSCSINDYYQVYTAHVPNENIKNDEIIYTHDRCVVKYKFNNNGENVTFSMHNTSDNLITLDLTKSFFVLNGRAYSYFQNRSVSRQFTSTISMSDNYQYYNLIYNIPKFSGTNSSGISITYHETPLIIIPPGAFIELSEFSISKTPFVSCMLEKYPLNKNVYTMQYSKINSPFVFDNRLTYYVTRDTQNINHEFYIEEITNYPQDKLLITRDTNNCGKKLDFQVYTLKKFKPNQFYIKYQRQ